MLIEQLLELEKHKSDTTTTDQCKKPGDRVLTVKKERIRNINQVYTERRSVASKLDN